MKVSDLLPSKFLRLEDVPEPKSLTIDGVEWDDRYEKFVLHFAEIEQAMSLNKTNTKTLRRELGDETDNWIGQRAVVFQGQFEVMGEMQPGLQIRVDKNAGGAKKPAENAYAKVKGKTGGNGGKPLPEDDIPFMPDR